MPANIVKNVAKAAEHVYHTEELILSSMTADQNQAYFAMIHTLVKLAADHDSFDVFFLMSIKVESNVVYHFLESGRCVGYLHNTDNEQALHYRIHTEEDLSREKSKNGRCYIIYISTALLHPI